MTDLEERKIEELKKILKEKNFSPDEIFDIGVPLSLFKEKETVENLNKMIAFLKEKPNATYDEIQDQVFIILGVELEDEEE